jgi:hypothetical protein
MTPEDLLDGLSTDQAAIVQRLRRLVRSAVPDATERVYPVWRGIGYRHPEAGYFCGIFPLRAHVGLAFEYGALLPDPNGYLQPGRTSSRKVRYLEFRGEGDVHARVVKQFVRTAVSFKASLASLADRGSGGTRRRRTRS